jgi:hypothetical protein
LGGLTAQNYFLFGLPWLISFSRAFKRNKLPNALRAFNEDLGLANNSPALLKGSIPGTGTSSDFLAFGVSSDFSAFGVSSDFLAFDVSSDFLAFDVSSDFSAFGVSSDFSAFDVSSDFLAFDVSSDFSAFGVNNGAWIFDSNFDCFRLGFLFIVFGYPKS